MTNPPSAATRMRDPAVTPVLVLKMSISNASPVPAGSTCPVSSAQSGNAAVMLPQFTLQSIAALSAASCAKVLTMRRRFPSASSRAKNTLLPVGTIRPNPVICLLPARVPSSGSPIRWRSSSSRRVLLARRPVFRDHQPGRCAATHVVHGKFDASPAQAAAADRARAVCMVHDPDCPAPQLLLCGCEVHCDVVSRLRCRPTTKSGSPANKAGHEGPKVGGFRVPTQDVSGALGSARNDTMTVCAHGD